MMVDVCTDTDLLRSFFLQLLCLIERMHLAPGGHGRKYCRMCSTAEDNDVRLLVLDTAWFFRAYDLKRRDRDEGLLLFSRQAEGETRRIICRAIDAIDD
jgi:hypothetical protein